MQVPAGSGVGVTPLPILSGNSFSRPVLPELYLDLGFSLSERPVGPPANRPPPSWVQTKVNGALVTQTWKLLSASASSRLT